MSSATQIAFLIVHVALNPYLIGGSTVALAAVRELYPRWERHPVVRVFLDLAIVVLLAVLLPLTILRLAQ